MGKAAKDRHQHSECTAPMTRTSVRGQSMRRREKSTNASKPENSGETRDRPSPVPNVRRGPQKGRRG
jgi:hypothetical protein